MICQRIRFAFLKRHDIGLWMSLKWKAFRTITFTGHMQWLFETNIMLGKTVFVFIQYYVAGKSSIISHYTPAACNGTQPKVDMKRHGGRAL